MGQTNESPCRVLTISATYGAGGSVIAPQVANRLGLPFHNRLVSGPETPSVEGLVERLTIEEERDQPTGRIMVGLTRLGAGFGLPTPSSDDMDPRPRPAPAGRRERVPHRRLRRRRDPRPGGRRHPRRRSHELPRPPRRAERPVPRQGMAIEGTTEDVAHGHQATTDRAWSRFVTRLFDRDPTDPRLYHVTVDSTVVPLDHCVGLIAAAATAFWERADGEQRSPSTRPPTA